MKTIKLFIYALIVCFSFVSIAEAKGRSGSFKGGFSSQKRPAAKPAKTYYQAPPANTQTKQSGFGSFGSGTPKTDQKAATIPQSKMSQDLSAKNAQTNAMNAVDARANPNATTNTTNNANSESGWFRSGNQNAAAQKTAATGQATNTYQPASPQPNGGQVGSRQHSSGLLPALAGFMIGNSLAQQHNTGVVHKNDQGNAQDGQAAVNSTDANGVATQQAQDVPAVETESFFMKLLRLVLWLAIIVGVVLGIRKVAGLRNGKVNRAANYSLGR